MRENQKAKTKEIASTLEAGHFQQDFTQVAVIDVGGYIYETTHARSVGYHGESG